MLTKEGVRQITLLVQEQETYILETAQQQVSRIIAVTQPIGRSEISESTLSMIEVLDYTDKMTPVRDQGVEGSGVGFAVAAGLEYQIEKVLGQRVVISPRYIYYYARLKGGQSTDQDSGAHFRDAVSTLSEMGTVAEDVWPYKAGEFHTKPPDGIEQAQHYKISESRAIRNSNEIKSALEQFGPVVGGIAMYSSFLSNGVSKTGKIPMPSPSDSVLGTTAVCFVGYDDNQKLLKFKNSWGNAWGDQGYGYISYEYADKFLTDAWAISMERAEGQ